MSEIQFFYSLILAVALGAVIGLERQWRQRMAGLRTNSLVSAGAALFVMLSASVGSGHDGDIFRIAAQVVSGVGFLGAGVIMRDGLNVRGLNTAATLWCSAAVGLLCGSGFHFKATIGALAVLGTNVLLRPVAQKINRTPRTFDAVEEELHYQIKVVCRENDETHVRYLVLQAVSSSPLVLKAIHSEDVGDGQRIEVRADIDSVGKNNSILEQVVSRLSLEKGVSAVTWKMAHEAAA